MKPLLSAAYLHTNLHSNYNYPRMSHPSTIPIPLPIPTPTRPSQPNGECFCLNCNVFMGWQNPRQLCGKYMCDNDDMWYRYRIGVESTESINPSVSTASTASTALTALTALTASTAPSKSDQSNQPDQYQPDQYQYDQYDEPTMEQLYWLVDNKWTKMD